MKILQIFLLLSFSVFSSQGQDSTRWMKLDSFLKSAVLEKQIPGAVVYISQNGKELFHQAYGFRSIEENSSQHTNDIFRMASMTKALTAVSILQLVESKVISLDDKICKYIPEFNQPKVLVDLLPDSGFTSKPALSDITIKQLLTHTSGIGYGFQNEKYNTLVMKHMVCEGFGSDYRTSLENAKLIATLPLLSNPGEKFIYSLSYDVLSTLIELVSGKRYDEYIESNILIPLGMRNSYFYIPPKEQSRLVVPYEYSVDATGFKITSYNDKDYPLIEGRLFFSGGADLCSTASDYAKFMEMILNKGVYNGRRILGKKFIRMMLSKQTSFPDGNSYLGFSTWITNKKGAANGSESVGSFGFAGFWDTSGWADPHENIVVITLLQLYPNNRYNVHENVKKITYQTIRNAK